MAVGTQTPGFLTATWEVKIQFVCMAGGRQILSERKVASKQKFGLLSGCAQKFVCDTNQRATVAAEIILNI